MSQPLWWGVRGTRFGYLLTLVPILVSVLGACGPSRDSSGSAVSAERDSAGVRVVTLGNIYTLPLPEWPIGERLSIGRAMGTAEHQLYRVADATVLDDGTIAVANSGSGEIIMFDDDGQHLRTFGGEGEGPGEFQRLGWIAKASGDTLVTFDNDLRRATWFTYSGAVVRTLTVDPDLPEPANATPYGTTSVQAVGFARGQLLVRAGYSRRTGGPSGEGEYRDPFTVYRVDERGALADPLGSYPGQELYFQGTLPGPILALPPIFGRDTRVAAAGNRLVVGANDRVEIDVYQGMTLHMRLVAVTALPAVTPTEVDAWRRRRHARASEVEGPGGEVARRLADHAPARETPPAFQRLTIDREHFIWVEEPYRTPDGVSRWIILDATGIPRAQVRLPMRGPTSPESPPDLRVLEVGDSYILGLRRDELEVEQVVVYTLGRGE